MKKNSFDSIESAIKAIASGEMIVVVDDENRENEGDLVMAAEKVTPEAINFMTQFGRGLICMPMEKEQLEKLDLHPMTAYNSDPKQTAFTVSVDAKTCETGISAFERADTILQLASEKARASDFTKPGHIFPLRAMAGGVLKRDGHTEAAVDLSRLAGLKPSGVICEILKEDGSMARVADLITFKERHGLKLISIKDLILYRKKHENMVRKVAEANLPTQKGTFKMLGYENLISGEEHLVLYKPGDESDAPFMVRLHSECLTGDALGSLKCDCGTQLQNAMQRIESNGKGAIIYLRQEGRGIGLLNKIKAYALQEKGFDTLEANKELGFKEDLRDYTLAAHILKDLNQTDIHLMTNNPDKVSGLENLGINVVRRLPAYGEKCPENTFYMETKIEKLGHYDTH